MVHSIQLKRQPGDRKPVVAKPKPDESLRLKTDEERRAAVRAIRKRFPKTFE